MAWLPPPTDWKETISPDEATRFEGYAKQIGDIQRKSAARGQKGRALHTKGLAGVRARLTVNADLPDFAKVGLFAQPKSFDAWVRFSNGMGQVNDDHKGDVRGMAIKVLGVPGKKVIPGMENAQTQDFSMIQGPALAFHDAAEFMFFVGAAQNQALLLPRMIGHFGFGRTLRILKGLTSGFLKPMTSLASRQFWTPVPIKYGPYAARYSAKPVSPPAEPQPSRSPRYLGEDLVGQLAKGPLSYDLLFQFYADPVKTPIEDASVDWESPYLPVARLTLLQQDLASPKGVRDAAYVEQLSFDPWHALEEHRPLGNVMRARGPAYRESTTQRQAIPEPAGFPD
jgi:hypothetical protein